MFGEGHGALGTWLYTHMLSVLLVGRKRTLHIEDVPPISSCDKPEAIGVRTQEYLQEASQRLQANKSNRICGLTQPTRSAISFWTVLLQVHRWLLIPPAVFKLFGDLINFVPIICMKYLLLSLSIEEEVSMISRIHQKLT